MLTSKLSVLLLIVVPSVLLAQDLYIPRDIKRAYEQQTRKADGKPGKNYWQNRARYRIELTANPPLRTIKGTESIVYLNNSPDSLKELSLKLFQNIHKPVATRDIEVTPSFLTEGVVIDSIRVGSRIIETGNQATMLTNWSFRLPQVLAPHDSVDLRIAWHYEIALQGTKEGMVDSTTFFLGLFYPRVAVYDDYDGWDDIPYTGSREFYSDYNDYDVCVRVPGNFIVWGTGNLVNPENVLSPDIYRKYKKALTSTEVVHIVTQGDLNDRKFTEPHSEYVWQFVAHNVPDVAFGISEHYVWDAASVLIDREAGRRVMVQAAYNDSTEEYHHIARYGQNAVSWYSKYFPGIAFPYSQIGLFQTFEEMEYPMMIKASAYGDTTFAKFVAEHEIAHSYFPFYVGTNETRYGFMDEGWATTFELLIGRVSRGEAEAEQIYKQIRVLGWKYNRSAGEDMPIINPTSNVTAEALGDNEYGKPSLAFLALKDMLGDELFKKCLREFVERWHGKHPIPWDMFYTFNNIAGENLNWFWDNWFLKNYFIDLSIDQVIRRKNHCKMRISNIGGIAIPFNIRITYEDGSNETVHKTAGIWKENRRHVDITIPLKKSCREISIDGGIFVDANSGDNSKNF